MKPVWTRGGVCPNCVRQLLTGKPGQTRRPDAQFAEIVRNVRVFLTIVTDHRRFVISRSPVRLRRVAPVSLKTLESNRRSVANGTSFSSRGLPNTTSSVKGRFLRTSSQERSYLLTKRTRIYVQSLSHLRVDKRWHPVPLIR